MRVMVIVKATKDSEAGVMPSTELLTAMGQFNEVLVQAGIIQDGAGLTPSSRGVRVRFSGTSRTVVHGPFTETNELIAGYWIWKVQSLQEAIDWVKKCPNPMLEDSDIEIRPFFEMEDFGEAMTPELREQEARLQANSLGLLRVEFQSLRTITLAGLSKPYTMATRHAIPQQWAEFVSRLPELPSLDGHTYGVSFSHGVGDGFDYLTGVEVANDAQLAAGLTSSQLPENRYAVFTHTGHVSELPKLIDTICCKWIPNCGLKAEPYLLERYTSEFDAQTGLGGMEVWVPIKH
jgi:AraC family transcriptional regulator